jgi:hypothetical protein
VQHRAAAAVDRSDGVVVENHGVFGPALGILGLYLQQAAPTSADSQDAVSIIEHTGDHRLDASVQPGHITPAGQYSYSHSHPSVNEVSAVDLVGSVLTSDHTVGGQR